MMETHIRELKEFANENVIIKFQSGSREKTKEAFIRKFSGFRLFAEGLNDPSGRTYRIKVPQILEVISLEKSGKIWRK